MNKEIEEIFVKKFIKKDKQERTLHELQSPKKRDHIIQWLGNYADEKYVVLEDSNADNVLSKVKIFFDVSQKVYVIGFTDDDGKELPFTEAFEDLFDGGDYTIICNDCNTVLMRQEYHWGKAVPVTVLHRNN